MTYESLDYELERAMLTVHYFNDCSCAYLEVRWKLLMHAYYEFKSSLGENCDFE